MLHQFLRNPLPIIRVKLSPLSTFLFVFAWLWKAADQQGPPKLDITKYVWEMKSVIPIPCVDTDATSPEGLIDVINCGCKALGKACSTDICSCHRHNMSCTVCAQLVRGAITQSLWGTLWMPIMKMKLILIKIWFEFDKNWYSLHSPQASWAYFTN